MTWDDFRDRLGRTLPGVTDRCFLIISAADGGGYVQFAGTADALSAEAAGPEFVTGTAAHSTDDPAMAAAGWTAPSRSTPNWSTALELPALTSEFAALAQRCVTALRNAHHVTDPETLTYQAWREPEVQPAGLTWAPERFAELDPGENPLLLPSLGLEPQAA